MLWRAPCGKEWQETFRGYEWPLQQSRDLSPTTAGNWILPTMSLKENPDESVVLVNILISALWFQPEQRIQLPHDHTSNLQKLEANKWCYFTPLNLCDLLHSNRKLVFAFAWQSPGCSSKLNSKGFEEMSFLVCHPLKFSKRRSAWCWYCVNQSLISATPSVGNSFLKCLS